GRLVPPAEDPRSEAAAAGQGRGRLALVFRNLQLRGVRGENLDGEERQGPVLPVRGTPARIAATRVRVPGDPCPGRPGGGAGSGRILGAGRAGPDGAPGGRPGDPGGAAGREVRAGGRVAAGA